MERRKLPTINGITSYDGKKKYLYVDGKLDAEVSSPHKVMGKAITRYGFIGVGSEAGGVDGAVGPNWHFKGVMEEFFLYHRAITAKEVSHLAKGPANPFAVDTKSKLTVSWAQIKDVQ